MPWRICTFVSPEGLHLPCLANKFPNHQVTLNRRRKMAAAKWIGIIILIFSTSSPYYPSFSSYSWFIKFVRGSSNFHPFSILHFIFRKKKRVIWQNAQVNWTRTSSLCGYHETWWFSVRTEPSSIYGKKFIWQSFYIRWDLSAQRKIKREYINFFLILPWPLALVFFKIVFTYTSNFGFSYIYIYIYISSVSPSDEYGTRPF